MSETHSHDLHELCRVLSNRNMSTYAPAFCLSGSLNLARFPPKDNGVKEELPASLVVLQWLGCSTEAPHAMWDMVQPHHNLGQIHLSLTIV